MSSSALIADMPFWSAHRAKMCWPSLPMKLLREILFPRPMIVLLKIGFDQPFALRHIVARSLITHD